MKLSRFTIIVAALILLGPSVALAHTPKLWGTPPGYWGPLVAECPKVCDATGKVCSSICPSLCNALDLAQHLIYFGMSLVLFVLTPVLLLWGGFMIIIAGGSAERLNQGKKIFTGTVIGLAITLGAFLIINTFVWALGVKTGTKYLGWPNISCSAPR